MGLGIGTILGIASLVTGLVGTGVAYYGAQEASRSQDAIAASNAAFATQQARQNGELARMEAAMNQTLAQIDANAQRKNAEALRQQAESGSQVANENIRRTRREFDQLLSAQRASLAASGVIDTTGSPLKLLMQTAEDEQATAEQMRYEDEISRRQLFTEADMTERGASITQLQGAQYRFRGEQQAAAYRNQATQAKLDRYSANASSRAMRTAATGNLLAGVSNAASDAYTGYRNGTFNFGRSPRAY